jgi:hypothetical protein
MLPHSGMDMDPPSLHLRHDNFKTEADSEYKNTQLDRLVTKEDSTYVVHHAAYVELNVSITGCRLVHRSLRKSVTSHTEAQIYVRTIHGLWHRSYICGKDGLCWYVLELFHGFTQAHIITAVISGWHITGKSRHMVVGR